MPILEIDIEDDTIYQEIVSSNIDWGTVIEFHWNLIKTRSTIQTVEAQDLYESNNDIDDNMEMIVDTLQDLLDKTNEKLTSSIVDKCQSAIIKPVLEAVMKLREDKVAKEKNSALKGTNFEDIVYQYLLNQRSKCLVNYDITNTSKGKNFKADIQLTPMVSSSLPDILIDTKDYNVKVPHDELLKLVRDVKTIESGSNNWRYGILVTRTPVIGYDSFEMIAIEADKIMIMVCCVPDNDQLFLVINCLQLLLSVHTLFTKNDNSDNDDSSKNHFIKQQEIIKFVLDKMADLHLLIESNTSAFNNIIKTSNDQINKMKVIGLKSITEELLKTLDCTVCPVCETYKIPKSRPMNFLKHLTQCK